MTSEILTEQNMTLPAVFSIKKQAGDRYQLNINNKDVYNFYEGEQLYLHVDQGVLSWVVTKTKQEESEIKRRLKALIWVFKHAFTGKLPKEF